MLQSSKFPHFWQIICCYIVKFCSFENCKMTNGSCSVLAGIINLDIFHYFSNITPSVWLVADPSGVKLFRCWCKETLNIDFKLFTTFPLKMSHWSEKISIFTFFFSSDSNYMQSLVLSCKSNTILRLTMATFLKCICLLTTKVFRINCFVFV